MALIRASSVLPSLGIQVARALPVAYGRVASASYPYAVQKRNLLAGLVIHTAIDAALLSTGCAAVRRVTGFDARQYADYVENPSIRRGLYQYLDFGERCADKVTVLFRRGMNKERRKYQDYNHNPNYNQGNQPTNYDHYRRSNDDGK